MDLVVLRAADQEIHRLKDFMPSLLLIFMLKRHQKTSPVWYLDGKVGAGPGNAAACSKLRWRTHFASGTAYCRCGDDSAMDSVIGVETEQVIQKPPTCRCALKAPYHPYLHGVLVTLDTARKVAGIARLMPPAGLDGGKDLRDGVNET